MSENPDQQEKLLTAFLTSNKVLIADSSGVSRSGLAKILASLGTKPANLLLADCYVDAKEIIEKHRPGLVISDYMLGNRSGIELGEDIRKNLKKNETVFVLVTSNSTQSAVAQAAEEDVDVFILKPYNIKNFTEILTRSVLAKLYPSDYIKMIWEGKRLLDENQVDDALLQFKKAIAYSGKPTLAYYYQAQGELKKKLYADAEKSYLLGLKVNNMHYRCLTGLFDLFVSQKRNEDAYSLVKKISNFFPANPSRLGLVLSLAIKTGNFGDIESYYETFKEIEIRNDDLIRIVCASLVVCGKHFFKQKDRDKALDYLKKASITAAGRTLILREIVTVLIDNEMVPEAEEVLKRFSDASRDDPHWRVSEFLVKNKIETDKSRLIPELRNLVRDQFKEPVIWYWLIYHLVDLEKFEEAETVCDEALKMWPEKQEYFESALKFEEEDQATVS